jgi:DNA polymerase IV
MEAGQWHRQYPVEPYSEQKSISTERTFEQDTTDVKMMRALLAGMVEKLCYELRSQHRLTSCVTIKLRYANFDTHTLQKRIPYTSFDHTLAGIAGELFDRLYSRRMLIRLLGVRFTHLVQGTQQLNLFEDTPEMVNLYRTVDQLKNRFGKKAVVRAINI